MLSHVFFFFFSNLGFLTAEASMFKLREKIASIFLYLLLAVSYLIFFKMSTICAFAVCHSVLSLSNM
jgi:hypothetical protein